MQVRSFVVVFVVEDDSGLRVEDGAWVSFLRVKGLGLSVS